MNIVILTGRVSSDITVRYTKKGTAVANFDIATQRSFTKDKDGKYPVDFHHVVVWNKLAETCQKNLIKGRRIGVRGALGNNTYTDKDGNKKYNTVVTADVVEFLDSRKSNRGTAGQESDMQADIQVADADFYAAGIPDEEIPF